MPFLLPIPIPGLSVLFGAVIFFAGVCMVLNLKPWLPDRFLDKPMSVSFLARVFETSARLSLRLEKFVKPRGAFVAAHPGLLRMNGAVIAICGLLMALPLPPGTNFTPAACIVILAIATLEEDVVLMTVGWLTFIINLFFFGVLFYYGTSAVTHAFTRYF